MPLTGVVAIQRIPGKLGHLSRPEGATSAADETVNSVYLQLGEKKRKEPIV